MLSRIFKRSRALLPRRAGASPRRWNNPLGGRMNNTRKADPGGLYSRRGWSFIFRRRPTRMLFGSSGGFPAHVPRVFSSGQVRRAIVGRRSFTGDAERTGWKTSAAWKSFSCLGTRPPRALSPEKRPNDSLSLSLSLSFEKARLSSRDYSKYESAFFSWNRQTTGCRVSLRNLFSEISRIQALGTLEI